MEILAWSYFLIWATISVIFTRLGFNTLNKTDLSNSVSPLFMCLFKHSLAFSASLSSVSAFLFFPRLKINNPNGRYVHLSVLIMLVVEYLVFVWFLTFLFHRYFGSSWPTSYMILFTLLSWMLYSLIVRKPVSDNRRLLPDSPFRTTLIIHSVVGSSLVLVGDNKTRFFPCTLLNIAFLITLSWLSTVSVNDSFDELLFLASIVKEKFAIFMKEKMKGKFIEFGVGIVGTILFQNYFKLTSPDHVDAFFYFAVAWLANLALTRGHGDFGVFNFLLSNVMVGCTVSQFGLRADTWYMYADSLFLFGLRLKLESLALVQNDNQVVLIVDEN